MLAGNLEQTGIVSETKINGYSEVRSVRPGRRGRGGVSIYVREGFTVLDSNEYSNEECGVAHVRIKQINSTNIFSLYHPPTASVKSFKNKREPTFTGPLQSVISNQ